MSTAAAHTLKRRLAMLGVAIAVFAAIGGTCAASHSSAADGPLKLMPLGDSITDGFNIPGGYRIDLEDDMVASGVVFDFVGSLSNGPTSLADKNHEGHSGWRIDQIDGSIGSWLATHQPDAVLLLIGTNDVAQDYQLATAPDRLAALVDRIHGLRPATKLFVSSIPPLANTTDRAQADAYNAAIPGIVNARASQGRPIWFVNAGGALALSDLADGVHPNAPGYTKIADAWHSALIAGLGRPSVSLTSPANGTVISSGDDVRLAASASDADGIAKVEFFAGSTMLGEDSSAPYEWLWINPPAGTHSLTARATDLSQAATTSTPVSISVDPPAGESVFYRAINLGGGAVTIDGRSWEATTAANVRTATTTYENQSIALIPATDPARASMIRNVVWGSIRTEVSLLSVPAGTYDVYLTVWEDNRSATFDIRLEGAVVRAGYQSGNAGTWARLGPWRASIADGSLDVTAGPDANLSGIEVFRVTAGANAPPSVSLTAPTAGAVFGSGDDVQLTASASDAGGIARVEFFAGDTKLGADSSAPYEWLWIDPPAGTHSLTARATDVAGATASSSPASITVQASAAPQASAQSVTTAVGAPIGISLSGSDADTCELTYSIASVPSHGTISSISGDSCQPGAPNRDSARVTYTPAQGYSGADSFSYRVSDGTSTSAPATVAITIQAAQTGGDPTALHIGDLDGRMTTKGNTWSASVVVAVVDGLGASVAGVSVGGTWSATGSGSCVTGSDGHCTVTLAGIQKKTKSVTFTVVQAAKASFQYEPATNTDPDGDSNGTSITVARA